MKKILFTLAFLFTYIFSQSQNYCVPAYNGTLQASNFYVHVLFFSFGDINRTFSAPFAQTSPTYYDYTSYTGTYRTKLVPGHTYPVDIIVGNGGNTQTLSVWIDYNQNKIFESTERLFTRIDTANVGDHSIHVNITIPKNAVIGSTRLRVGSIGGTDPPDPCSNNQNVASSQHFQDYTVEIVNPQVQTYQASDAVQSVRDEVTPGSSNNNIMEIRVITNSDGTLSPLMIDSMYLSTLGTTNPSEISGIKLFYTGKSPLFSTTTQIGTTLSNSSTYFTLPVKELLEPGINYFWLTYDISPSAVLGNFIDARCNGVFVNARRFPNTIDPTGNRRIGYCVSKGNKSTFVYVRNVQLGAINRFSYYASTGYSDYTNDVTTLNKNMYHTLTVETGNGVNSNYARAWIDFNRDGIFDYYNELVLFDSIYIPTGGNPSYGPVIDSFQVPLNAPPGPTRMRVIAHYNPNTPPFRIPANPCDNPVEVGEVEDYTVIIADKGQPVADFSADIACLGSPTSFTDKSYTFDTFKIDSWLWEFGDGDTSHAQKPTHTYTQAGIYNVKLTVNTNYAMGIPSTITKAVKINDPRADFSINTNLYKNPVRFVDETKGGMVTSWYWNFGDPASGYNNFSNAKTPNHTFDTIGTYAITFIATVEGGCIDTIVKNIYIDSIIAPIADFSPSNSNPYYEQKFTLADLSVNNPSYWLWEFSPNYVSFHNGTDMNTQNPEISFDSIATYTVKLTVSNVAGTDSVSKQIISSDYSKPEADFSASPLSVKADQLVSFLDLSKNDPNTWTWIFGDGDSAFTQHPLHAYKNVGNYSVKLNVSNPKGIDSKTKTNYIKVTNEYQLCDNNTPSSRLFFGYIFDSGGEFYNYGNNNNCGFLIQPDCAGPITLSFESFEYEVNDFVRVYDGVDNKGKKLFSGNGFSGNSIPANVVAKSGAMYIEEVTNQEQTLSGFKAKWTAVPNIAPKAVILADTVGYKNGPVTFRNGTNLGTGNIYLWDYDNDGVFEDSNKTEGQHIYDSNGIYTVTLIANNCKGTDTTQHVIRITDPKAPPVADFISSLDTALELDKVYLYDRSSNGPTDWYWEIDPPSYIFADGTNELSQNPIVMFYNTGSYHISLTSQNKIGSSAKTTKQDFIFIKTKATMCQWPFTVTFPAGRVFDAGGPENNYSNNENCTYDNYSGLLIQPCAERVFLKFLEFDFAPGDYVRVYDGIDNTGKPLHPGQGFTGSNLPATLVAESGAMFLEEITNSTLTASGFVADWSIEPIEKPKASFTSPDTAYTGGNIISFENTSRGKIDKFYWDYDNDGIPDDSINTNGYYSWNVPGTYIMSLTASNCAGSSKFSKGIRVKAPVSKPLADFTVNHPSGDVSDVFTFTDISLNGPNKWKWIFEPGNVLFSTDTDTISPRPVIVFPNTGKYDVTLIAENSFGADTMIKKEYINIFSYCRPSVNFLIQDFGISKVFLHDLYNVSSAGQFEYTDFSAFMSATLELGGTYDFEINSSLAAYPFNRKIWIDFNNDGYFNDTTELAAVQQNANTTLWAGQLTIPPTAKLGRTRMRIGVNQAAYPNKPCGPNQFGEYEDYMIYITPDKTPPKISLLGQNPTFSEIGYSFVDPGAKAIDAVDGDISNQIVIVSNVDTAVIGEYEVSYNCMDIAGNIADEVIRKVFVSPDQTKPVIMLKGFNPMLIAVHHPYIEPGATAIDNIDGDVSSNIVIQNTVDTGRVDSYSVYYTAYDYSNNFSDQIIRTVYVADTVKPLIHLIGSDTVKIDVGQQYNDSGAYVTDNYYENVSLKTTSYIDINVDGYYWVRYEATDPSGNAAIPVQRTVVVGKPVSVKEQLQKECFHIYPNPTQGSFVIDFDLKQNAEFHMDIVNSLGVRVERFEDISPDQKRLTINLEGFASGVYFVRIYLDEKIISRKITLVE
jgi:PKD repeat protein